MPQTTLRKPFAFGRQLAVHRARDRAGLSDFNEYIEKNWHHEHTHLTHPDRES
jgi:hypothetical protein